MSSIVIFNGSSFVIPATGETNWGNNVSSYLIAIAAGALQKTGGSFLLSNETDFGAGFGLKSLYYKSRSSNVASTGILRLNNNSDAIAFRNFANSADLSLLVNASDQLTFAGSAIAFVQTFTVNRAIISDGSGNLTVSPVTSTEVSYLAGVTSSIQTQLNTKALDSAVVHNTGNESVAGIKTFTTQLIGKGTATNDDAATGYIGEFIVSNTQSASLAAATTQFKDFVSITLSPGDWEVTGTIGMQGDNTVYTNIDVAISLFSNNVQTDHLFANNLFRDSRAFGTTDFDMVTVPNVRIAVPAGPNVTVYLKGAFTYTSGNTPRMNTGQLEARRPR